MEVADSAIVKPIENQNIGEAGSEMLAPIKVAVMTPGSAPKMLPVKYLEKGI